MWVIYSSIIWITLTIREIGCKSRYDAKMKGIIDLVFEMLKHKIDAKSAKGLWIGILNNFFYRGDNSGIRNSSQCGLLKKSEEMRLR